MPELIAFYGEYFAPVIAAYAHQDGDPARLERLHRDLLDFARTECTGPFGGRWNYDFDYLQVTARRI